MTTRRLDWQSKLILLIVVPYAAVNVVMQARTWSMQAPYTAIWVVGASALLGLLAWKSRSGTAAGSAARMET